MKIVEYGKENKDVIMLLHGGGLSWWNYRKEAELLCDQYHVVLPILDGHAGSDADFISIESTAQHVISLIDPQYHGKILVLGGLSLGGQVVVEMLAQRKDICQYAIVESASVIQDKFTNALIKPSIESSYGLIQKKWFAKAQFQYLKISADLFEDYYRDTSLIRKDNMVAFLKASLMYQIKPALKECQAAIRVIVGAKEQKSIKASATLLNQILGNSSLEIKDGLHHGEYSINHPHVYVEDLLKFIGK